MTNNWIVSDDKIGEIRPLIGLLTKLINHKNYNVAYSKKISLFITNLENFTKSASDKQYEFSIDPYLIFVYLSNGLKNQPNRVIEKDELGIIKEILEIIISPANPKIETTYAFCTTKLRSIGLL